MVDPSKHADHRGWIESVLRHIPGFGGYLEKEYRRESDYLVRVHLADRLQAGKRGLHEFQRALMTQGRLTELSELERVNTTLDTLINLFRGEVRGYSGFFDYVQIDEAGLERIYEHDLQLVSDVEAIVKQTQALQPEQDDPTQVATQLQTQLEALAEKFSLRTKILTGLAPLP
jgi:hypothetical protein